MERIDAASPPFGVWASARTVLGIFLARWRFFVPVSVATSLLYSLGLNAFEPFDAPGAIGSSPGLTNGLFILAFVVATAMFLIISVCENAVYVMAAYDTKAGDRIDLADYLRAMRQNLVPLVCVAVAVGFLAFCGFLLLVFPGIWISCVYAVAVPAVIIDRSGLGAMRRSRFLTKGYRWSILGLGCLMGLLVMAVHLSIYMIEIAVGSDGPASFLFSILSGITNSIIGITAAVGHMRLTALKASQSYQPIG